MQIKSKAIVLSSLKFRDNDLIVKCYTEKQGLVSFLVRGVLSKKRKNGKAAYFQLLSQLEIDYNHKENQNLKTLREVRPYSIYRSLHTNLIKSSLVMFLSEILSGVLKEEEANVDLFSYLEASFQWLDVEEHCANFHLLFLLKLSKYLGFYPDIERIDKPYFNLQNGMFQDSEVPLYSLSGKNLEILKTLLGINFDALNEINLNSTQRQSFLTMLLLYFELHLGNFKKPKSLKVFNQVFN